MSALNVTDRTGIYQQALRVGTPRSIDTPTAPKRGETPTITKKYVREVQVPYQRNVKVPVTRDRIVPATQTKTVETTKLVEVPSYKIVDETYIEYEERPVVREKVVWVKKIVPERVMERVPVKKTRQVKQPCTEIKEVIEQVQVQVPTSKLVKEKGYRIDKVEDTKLCEVEEYRTFKLRPEDTGDVVVDKSRELGRLKGRHLGRSIGLTVHQKREVDDISDDTDSDEFPVTEVKTRMAFSSSVGPPMPPPGGYGSSLGLVVKNAQPTPGRPYGGVRVSKVHFNQPAYHAGVREGDVITHINNAPVGTLPAFRQAVLDSGNLVRLTIVRSGNTIYIAVKRVK